MREHERQEFNDFTGYIVYDNANLVKLDILNFGRTGDWVVEDVYTVAAHNKAEGIDRSITYWSEREQKREKYSVRGNVARLESASAVDMTTGKDLPLPRPLDSMMKWKPEANIKKLPVAVVFGIRPESITGDERCLLP